MKEHRKAAKRNPKQTEATWSEKSLKKEFRSGGLAGRRPGSLRPVVNPSCAQANRPQ